MHKVLVISSVPAKRKPFTLFAIYRCIDILTQWLMSSNYSKTCSSTWNRLELMRNLVWSLWGRKRTNTPQDEETQLREDFVSGYKLIAQKQLRIPRHGAVKEIKWYAKEHKDHTKKHQWAGIASQGRVVVQIPVKSSSVTNEVPKEPSYFQWKINQQGRFHGQFGTFSELIRKIMDRSKKSGTTPARTRPVKQQKEA